MYDLYLGYRAMMSPFCFFLQYKVGRRLECSEAPEMHFFSQFVVLLTILYLFSNQLIHDSLFEMNTSATTLQLIHGLSGELISDSRLAANCTDSKRFAKFERSVVYPLVERHLLTMWMKKYKRTQIVFVFVLWILWYYSNPITANLRNSRW